MKKIILFAVLATITATTPAFAKDELGAAVTTVMGNDDKIVTAAECEALRPILLPLLTRLMTTNLQTEKAKNRTPEQNQKIVADGINLVEAECIFAADGDARHSDLVLMVNKL